MLYDPFSSEGWLQAVAAVSDAIRIPSDTNIFPVPTSNVYVHIELPPEDENGVRRLSLVPVGQLIVVYTLKSCPKTSYILTNYKATLSIEESVRYIKENYFIKGP